MMRRKRKSRFWSPTVAATGWGDSTYAEMSWDKSRSASTRWAIAGIVFGLLVALVVFAPAAWLASAVASATGQRVLLADARGSVWSGSAVAVLTGGPGSRDASSLPGRVEWTLGLKGLGLALNARHACCLNGTVTLQVRPGFGTLGVTLIPRRAGSVSGRAHFSAGWAHRGIRCSSAAWCGWFHPHSNSNRRKAAGSSKAGPTWNW